MLHLPPCGIWLTMLAGLAARAAAPSLPALPTKSLPLPNPEVSLLSPVPLPTERFLDLFRPFRTSNAALSPDGRYLAYTLREGDSLAVIVVEIDHPEVCKAKVNVVTDESATPMMIMTDTREKTPAMVRWMRWAKPTRLVVETNATAAYNTGGEWKNFPGMIWAFDADGGNARRLVSPFDVARLTPVALTAGGGAGETPNTGEFAEAPDAGAAVVTPRAGTHIPRSPQVFDFAPGEPDQLLVRTAGVSSYGLYKVNIHTGKLSYLEEEIIEPGLSILVDRQGRARVATPDSTRTPFPHRFLCARKAGGRWVPLDTVAGIAGGPGFRLSPENYFGERAVPLGFDENPAILYFASNIGRDLFGIYGLNLTTGQRSGFSAENPEVDLYAPEPGVFPEPRPPVANGEGEEAADAVGAAEPPENGEEEDAAAAPGSPMRDRAAQTSDARSLIDSTTLVFDRFQRKLIGIRYESVLRTARWLRPEWQEVQGALEVAFPGHSVDILEWDKAGKRFLVMIRGPADPGAYYVYERGTRKAAKFAQFAPWFSEQKPPGMTAFACDSPRGGRITGLVTFPRMVRIKPVPLLVLCPREPWEQLRADFRPEVQVLADMGFAIAQVNSRGAWGLGVKHREAIKAGYEQAQVEDILTAVDHLTKLYQVNPRRVALLGEKHGGYVALRALQLFPERFRCALAIDAPVNLAGWIAETRWSGGATGPALTRTYFGDQERLKEAPLVRRPELITKPVFLAIYPGKDGAPRTSAYAEARRFAGAVRRPEVPVEFVDLETDYMRQLPRARSLLYQQIEQFLNTYIYEYKVKVGESVETKGSSSGPDAK